MDTDTDILSTTEVDFRKKEGKKEKIILAVFKKKTLTLRNDCEAEIG